MNDQNTIIAQVRDLLNRIQLKAIMISPVVSINMNAHLSQALEAFLHNNITYLVIVDHDNRLEGIITQKYIYKTCSPRKVFGEFLDYDPDYLLDGDSVFSKKTLDNYILRHMMKKNPFSLSPENSVAEAIYHMAKKNIGCIPIVDKDKKVVGLITKQEIVNFFAQFVG